MSLDPNPTRTPRAIEKAARLLAQDRVSLLPEARVYHVAGDSGDYAVIASPEGIVCPCRAQTPLCPHVLAVAQLRALPDPRPVDMVSELFDELLGRDPDADYEPRGGRVF